MLANYFSNLGMKRRHMGETFVLAMTHSTAWILKLSQKWIFTNTANPSRSSSYAPKVPESTWAQIPNPS